MKFTPLNSGNPPSPLRKFWAFILTVAILGLVLMFSAVLLVVIAVVGTIAWAYLWWKTRELRKQMRDLSRQATAPEVQASNEGVFEGEVIRVVDSTHEK